MAHRLYPHSEARLAKLRGEDEVLRLKLIEAGLSFPECRVAFLAALFACGDAEIAFEAARQQALLMCPPLGGDDGEPRVRGRAQLIAALRDLPNPYSTPPGSIQKGNTDIAPTEHSSLGAGPVDAARLRPATPNERLDRYRDAAAMRPMYRDDQLELMREAKGWPYLKARRAGRFPKILRLRHLVPVPSTTTTRRASSARG